MFKSIKSKINQNKLKKINVAHHNIAQLSGDLTVESSVYLSNLKVINHCCIGFLTYFGLNCEIRNAKIGRYCSIGKGVVIGLYNHPLHSITTHPIAFQGNIKYSDPSLFSKFQQSTRYTHTNTSVSLGHDVWVGHHAIIKSGISIGHGSVIAAGAVVTKDIPPYAVVAGNPARIIKFRFDADMVCQLLQSQWWLYDVSMFINETISYAAIDAFLQHLNKQKDKEQLPEFHPGCWRLSTDRHKLKIEPDVFFK